MHRSSLTDCWCLQVGIGWYLDGMSGADTGSGFATYDNMTDYLKHAQAPL